ncbi:MAG: hypothetical protein ACXWV2_06870, partial [Chitinophagaceae bacterium]
MKKYFLFPVLLLVTGSGSFAQLGDVLKRSAAEGARQGAQNATVKTADKVVDRTLDKIFGGKKNKKPKEPIDTTGQNKEKTKTDTAPIAGKGKVENGSLKTYSRYDFIPGEKIMGYDDFSQDAIGDFPAKWT